MLSSRKNVPRFNEFPNLPLSLPKIESRPLTSILITNYNYQDYIAEAIKSALNQSYPKREIIICDDGSTDRSVEIIRNYSNRFKNVKLIEKSNGGHASALNKAFAASRGTIICFLDADDLFESQKVQLVVETMTRNMDSGLAIHDLDLINEYGLHMGYSRYQLAGYIGPEITTLRPGLLIPQSSGLCFRREVLTKILPIQEEKFRSGVDWAIAYTAAYITKTIIIQKSLTKYRIHSKNLSGTTKTLPYLSLTPIEKTLINIEKTLFFVKDYLKDNYGLDVQIKNTRNYIEHKILFSILSEDKQLLKISLLDLKNAFKQSRNGYPLLKYFFWKSFGFLPIKTSKWLLNLSFSVYKILITLKR